MRTIQLCLFLSFATQVAAAGDETHPDWQISGKPTGVTPLPFQAARIEVRLLNRSNNSFETARDAANIRLGEVKGPNDKTFRRILGDAFDGNLPEDASIFNLHHVKSPPTIRPGEISVMDRTLGAAWERGGTTVLFSRPGVYWVRLMWYGPSSQSTPRVYSEPIRIEVAEPKGPDLKPYGLLAENAELAKELISPRYKPQPPSIKRLEQFTRDFPDSSYRDYARFALARAYLSRARRIGDVGSDESKKGAMDALAQLKAIDVRRNAYGDYVLASMSDIQREYHFGSPDDIYHDLDRLFPNSFERLERLAGRTPLDEWKKMNPMAPRKLETAPQ